MERFSFRIDRVEPVDFLAHDRQRRLRHFGASLIIICQQVALSVECSHKKEGTYISANDPFRGNQIDIRL